MVSSNKSVLWISLAVILLFAVTMTAIEMQSREPKALPPVNVADAEALLNRTVQMARDGHYDAICEEIPDVPNMCRHVLAGAKESKWWPGPNKPTIVTS